MAWSFMDKKNYFNEITEELKKVVVGQDMIIRKIMIAFLSDGHVLLEGVPGLAKTHILKSFAKTIDCSFKRLQFTPDLLPSDITGAMIFNQKDSSFEPMFGPIFNNIVLADEINRAPSKVQSALLQAMAESQVNLGGETYQLKKPFYVLATQNPIEHEGTYPLPEAQLDRFMFKLLIDYPTIEEEIDILSYFDKEISLEINKIISNPEIEKIKEEIKKVYIDEKIKKYIVEIVYSTRNPEDYNLSHIKKYIQWGASPRASINIVKAAKTNAYINGREFVLPEDVKFVVKDVLRHRIILSYEALADSMTTDTLLEEIIENRILP